MSKKKLPKDRRILAAEIVQRLFIDPEPQTQTEIAEELGIEKSTVSRLVAEARKEGLYSIHLNLPRDRSLELELNRLYHIDAVVEPIIQPRSPFGWPVFTRLLAETAARHLEEQTVSLLHSGQRIGIGCGATMRDLVTALTPHRFSGISLSQLTVETEYERNIDQSPFTIVSTLFGKWRGDSKVFAIQPLPGTLRTENGDIHPAYESIEKEIKEIARSLDVAILGIGLCDPKRHDSFAEILSDPMVDTKRLMQHKPVGEILNRPFDEEGTDLTEKATNLNRLVDSIGLETLRDLVGARKKVVAVAGGSAKIRAIRVVLQAGLVNYLITDVTTAEKLLA